MIKLSTTHTCVYVDCRQDREEMTRKRTEEGEGEAMRIIPSHFNCECLFCFTIAASTEQVYINVCIYDVLCKYVCN